MQLTPLEILLGSALLSLLVGLAVRLVMRGSFVTKQEFCSFTEEQKEKSTIIFRMLRAMIVHSDIDDEEKERILNDRGRK